MKMLAGATAGLSVKNAYDAMQSTLSGGGGGSATGGVNLSVSFGASKNESNTVQTSDTAARSIIAAGKDVRVSAIGAGTASDLVIQGSDVKGERDVTLIADHNISMLAATNTDTERSTNKSSSASIGGSIGTSGLLATASASFGRGRSHGDDHILSNAHVDAGRLLSFSSGQDTRLKGAVVTGKQITADIGGNLGIESLQDTSVYDSSQQSIGGSVSVGYGKASGSVNYSQSKVSSNFASVAEQSGMHAGEDGFDITVRGNTDLKGGVITSSDQATQGTQGEKRTKSTLTTGTLTQSEIQNKAEYDAQSVSVGVGYSYSGSGSGGSGVGQDQQGRAVTGGRQTPGSSLPSFKGFSATPPIAMSASDSAESTTRSGISGIGSGTVVTITDEKKQRELTGKDAAATVASIDTGVTTGKDTTNALKPIFDKNKEKEIQAGFAIAGALTREVGTFIENRAKESDRKKEEAKEVEQKAKDPSNNLSDKERQSLRAQAATLRKEAQEINKNWGGGGTYRQIATALVAATSGNVSAGTAEFTKGLVVNYLQQQGAGLIGDLVHRGQLKEGTPEHAALHAIVACAGGAASGGTCGSAAMGAASSSLLTNLFAETKPGETQAEREAKRDIITSLVTGIAMASSSVTGSSIDPAAATTAAISNIDNNWLATQQIAQMKKELAAARTPLEEIMVLGKWGGTSIRQDVLTSGNIAKGLADAGVSDISGLAEFLADPIKGLHGLKEIVINPEARRQLGEHAANELSAKIDRMSQALEQGGDQHAVQLGHDIGELVWQVGSVATAAYGVAKGGIALAKAGINVSAKGIEALANTGVKAAKLEVKTAGRASERLVKASEELGKASKVEALDSAESSKLVAKEGEAFVRALQGLDKAKASAKSVQGVAPSTTTTAETVTQGERVAEKLVKAEGVAKGTVKVTASKIEGAAELKSRVLSNVAESQASREASNFGIHTVVEKIPHLDVSTSLDEAIFWSGRGNRKLAESFADIAGKSTLEMTSGGQYLESLKLFDRFTGKQALVPWERLSYKFAEGASGKVSAFVKDAKPEGLFNRVEYPALLDNPHVTDIVFLPNGK